MVDRFREDPELPDQDQLAISNSEMASDSLPSLRVGVTEKEHSLPLSKSAAFGTYIKPLPCLFFSFDRRVKRASSLLRTFGISQGDPFFLGCLLEAGVEVVRGEG